MVLHAVGSAEQTHALPYVRAQLDKLALCRRCHATNDTPGRPLVKGSVDLVGRAGKTRGMREVPCTHCPIDEPLPMVCGHCGGSGFVASPDGPLDLSDLVDDCSAFATLLDDLDDLEDY